MQRVFLCSYVLSGCHSSTYRWRHYYTSQNDVEFIDVINTGNLARVAWRRSTLRLPWYVQEGGRSPTLFTTTGTVCGCWKAGIMQPLVCWHRGLSALLLASWHMLLGWLVWFEKKSQRLYTWWKRAYQCQVNSCCFNSTKIPNVPLRWGSCEEASYQIRKIAGCACAGNVGNVFPVTDFKRKNVPGIPGACATRNVAYLVRGPCLIGISMDWTSPNYTL